MQRQRSEPEVHGGPLLQGAVDGA
eukprot:SAG22_NODE_5101_length_1086_cov_1.165147_1_plen_23_part_10